MQLTALHHRIALSTVAALAAACVEAPIDDDLDDDLGDTAQAVEGGTLASAGQFARAASLHNCTATRISPRHVITALHCRPKPGDVVRFYDDGPFPDGVTRTVVTVTSPPGTSVASNGDIDWTDTSGRLADIAVLRLNTSVTTGAAAMMTWLYPGIEVAGTKVGAGKHEDDPDLFGMLRRKTDLTWSDTDSSGGFYTEEFALNGGDSGGAFYVSGRLQGVTHGAHLLGVWRGRFTSVAEHLPFILAAIDYAWSGDAPDARVLGGTVNATFIATHQTCQYACDNTASCVAYSYMVPLSQCVLLSSVSGSAASSAFRSARK